MTQTRDRRPETPEIIFIFNFKMKILSVSGHNTFHAEQLIHIYQVLRISLLDDKDKH